MEIVAIIAGIVGAAGAIYGIIELVEYIAKIRRQRRLAKKQRSQSDVPIGPFRLLNFSHPITPPQREAIEKALKIKIEELVDQPLQLLHDGPFEEQIRAAVNSTQIASEAWQASHVIVNLPGFAPATAVLLAELHGRMGHFPTVIRLRPLPNSSPQVYELAEIINLQTVRDTARLER